MTDKFTNRIQIKAIYLVSVSGQYLSETKTMRIPISVTVLNKISKDQLTHIINKTKMYVTYVKSKTY